MNTAWKGMMNETLRVPRRASAKSRAALKLPIQRVVCISDTHGLHRKVAVPEGDLLIHAGDFMRTGTSLEEIADFNDWLGEQPHQHKNRRGRQSRPALLRWLRTKPGSG